MKTKLLLHLFNIGDEPRLKSEQVADKLCNPPDKRMSVQPHEAWRKVGRDRLRHVWRPGMQTVDDRHLNHLNALSAHYHTHTPVTSQCNDTSSQSHLGRDASPPLTAESGLARCMCQLCSAHCRWVQSLSCRYTTSTLDRRTHDDGIQRASKRRTITTTTTRLAHSQNCCCGRILLEYLATSGTKS